MPWSIEKQGDQYCVVGGADGKTVKCHASRAKATAHMRAIYVNYKPNAKASIDDQEFTLILAKRFGERALGLSGYELADLEDQGVQGMLFVLPVSSQNAFHMEDMRFPLSVSFFDTAGRLVAQKEMQLGDVFRPSKPFKYVVELPLGTTFGENARLQFEEIAG